MKIDNNDLYPVIKKKIINMRVLRSAVAIFMGLAYLVCFIVNTCVGGAPWHLYVLVGEWLFWTLIMSRTLIEACFIRRLMNVSVVACLLLALLDGLGGDTGWARNIVIPIVVFGTLAIASAYFFARFRRQKQNFFLLFSFATGMLVITVPGIILMHDLQWPLIVLLSCAGTFVLATVAVFGKLLVHELRKHFHVNG